MTDNFEKDEFAIKSKNLKKLHKYKKQIKEQYGVVVNAPENDRGREGNVWVVLHGPRMDAIKSAKVFIKAFCNPEDTEVIDSKTFPLFIFSALQGFWRIGFQRLFSVVIKPKRSRNNFKIRGRKSDINMLVVAIKVSHQTLEKDEAIEEEFNEIVGDCVDPEETELFALSSGVKKLLLSLIKDKKLGFNHEKIRDKNIDQILEEKQILPTPKKNSLGFKFGEASTSKVKETNMDVDNEEKCSAKKSILGDCFGASQSNVENGSTEERMEFMKSPQADFLRQELKQYNFADEDIEAALSKHGPRFVFREVYDDLQDLDEERKRKAPSKDVDMISISSDDDVASCDDDVIFVKETPASQMARDVEFVCYLPGFPDRADVIKWFKAAYHVTNVREDSVPKLEILSHFRRHFKLTSHHKLNDNLFNCLGFLVSTDPAYSAVKTRGKAGQRRLICIKPSAGSAAPSSGGEDLRSRISNSAAPSTGGEDLRSRISNSAAPSSGGENPASSGILKDWIDTKSNVPSSSVVMSSNKVMTSSNIVVTSSNKVMTSSNKVMTSSHNGVTPAINPYYEMLKPVMSYNNNRGEEIPKNKPIPSTHNNTNYNPYSGHTPVTIPARPPDHLPQSSHNSYPGPKSVITPAPMPPHYVEALRSYNPHSGHGSVTTPVVNTRKISKLSNDELLRLRPQGGDPGLRPIIIDGSNVAVCHGNGKFYSVRGIAVCVNYFWTRGHRDIVCFIPNFRKGTNGKPPIRDRDLVFRMEEMGVVKITPSRVVEGRPIVCYDDRFILRLAEENDGVIVSNDQYRDLAAEKREWGKIIKSRLLQFTFVGDLFMPPDDPMGRHGPNLDELLRETPRYRTHVSTSSTMTSSNHQLRHDRITMPANIAALAGEGGRNSRRGVDADPVLLATQRKEAELDLLVMFPDKQNEIRRVLNEHKRIVDLTVLVNLLLGNE